MENKNNKSSQKRQEIPIWEKYALTIEETSFYTGIGQNTLRRFFKEHTHEDFILYVGTKILIKRKLFEEYADKNMDEL